MSLDCPRSSAWECNTFRQHVAKTSWIMLARLHLKPSNSRRIINHQLIINQSLSFTGKRHNTSDIYLQIGLIKYERKEICRQVCYIHPTKTSHWRRFKVLIIDYLGSLYVSEKQTRNKISEGAQIHRPEDTICIQHVLRMLTDVTESITILTYYFTSA